MEQTHIVRGRATSVVKDDKEVAVIYHNTEVVNHNYKTGRTYLNTGGYKTNTTKTRMNQAACQFNLCWRVCQENFTWYVVTPKGKFEFVGDAVIVTKEGAVLDAATGKKIPKEK